MAWLKLTGKIGASLLVNSDNLTAFDYENNEKTTVVVHTSAGLSFVVKESLEEIEMMLLGVIEAVGDPRARSIIGQ